MTGSEHPSRPIRVRPGIVAVVAITLVTLTATLVWQPWAGTRPGTGTSASPTVPGASPGADSSSGADASPGPDGEWGGVDLLPLAPVATLAPSEADAAGVSSTATFALTSLGADTAITLSSRIEVTPNVELDATTGDDTTTVTLTPAAALKAGTVYRFALRDQAGGPAASWAFRVRSPLHIIGMLPGDRTTDVPTDTGIEVTFDQEGAADIADHFSIEPSTDGRFERHGRTQVFVPQRLEPRTLYTVTISAGLPRAGTDLALEKDVVFRFETAGEAASGSWYRFGRDVVETSPTEAPVFGLQGMFPMDEAPAAPVKLGVTVYRLPSLEAAAATLADFLVAPRWTEHSLPLMPTEDLPDVATFTATVEPVDDSNHGAIRFPEPLPEGWYVVELSGARTSHAFLQVTPVSAWVSVLTDRTVVWANDVATAKPITGATVAIVDGARLGTADADGLMVAPTPDVLIPPAEARERTVPDSPPLLRIDSPAGDTVLVPFQVGWDGGIYRGEWWEKSTSADATYWSILATDRTLYRTTDTVEVWGYLRGRDDDKVPPRVDVRLVSNESSDTDGAPPIARTSATPGSSGTFTASLALDHAPLASYRLEAVVDGRVVARRWLSVDIIRKPTYRFAMTTDHLAVIAGSKVAWTTTATFFDGSPVPGIPVRFDDGPNEGTRVTAGTDGSATISLVAPAPEPEDFDWDSWHLGASPATQEEGDIWASESVLVFPASQHLKASGALDGRRLAVEGALNEVDLAKVEKVLAAGDWDQDPAGKPVAGRSVSVSVTELIPVKKEVGSTYDFIEKRVVPLYEYSTRREAVKSLTVRTGANGRLSFDLVVPDPKHEYEIALSTKDPDGRPVRRVITVGRAFELWWADQGVAFQATDGETAGETPYGIGERVSWRITERGEPIAPAPSDRFLYIVAQRGLRSAAVSDSATFERTFEPADAPGVFVMGVRFTGSTYAPKAASWANFDQEERRITVTVTADRERYRPGEDVTLSVRTTDAAGKPVPASIVLQAVDEKLYAMDGAYTPQPLDDLYARVDSGIVRLTATHQVPTRGGVEGEGGDTTGGGPRDEFKDTLLFRALTTDAAGRATATVRLSDDLTSWHVAASAVTADLDAGVGELLVPVSLPLFVDATVADEYLLSDEPVIRLRAYGDALRAGDAVEFTVSSESLGLAPVKVSGTAFGETDLALPALRLGPQKLDILVVAPTRTDAAGKPLADRLIRAFAVVSSRFTAARSGYAVVGETLPPVGGDEAAVYTFADAGRGSYLAHLLDLVDTGSLRLDRAMAEAIALDLLVEAFGRDPASLPPATFDPDRYPIQVNADESGVVRAGIALLPYGGPDPWLAARVAVVAPERVKVGQLREALLRLRELDSTQRDLWIAATAGLASLGEPVLADLSEARAAADLSVIEQLYLALGFAAIGDEGAALAMERDLLEAHGQQLGPWVRLSVGSSDDTAEATALLAVLAAGLGDPLARSMLDYVGEHRSKEAPHDLEVASAASRALERVPAVAASFAWTVDGRRTVVVLDQGESLSLSLTPEQRAGLALEPVVGKVGVAVAWREPVAVASLAVDPALSLSREVPGGQVTPDRLVTVQLHVEFGTTALEAGCYEVVEEVPSGLAPITGRDGDGTGSEQVIWPSSIVGQRVSFCVSNPVNDNGARTGELHYRARVVNEGTFSWEPAVMQLQGAAESIAVTGSDTIRIVGS